jgi:hypothetical protein
MDPAGKAKRGGVVVKGGHPMTFFLFLWIILAALVGVFASHRYHRSALGYFGIALAVSPVLGWLLVLALGKRSPAVAAGKVGGSAEGDPERAAWIATTVIAVGVMAIIAMLRP